jgi:kinesin family protein 18/19
MVYEATSSSLVSDVLMGYNATVFAYGATGSGKTHTMVGSPRQPGIMVRALNDLFQAVKDSKNPEQFEVSSDHAPKQYLSTGGPQAVPTGSES